jgi:hypothetical protein
MRSIGMLYVSFLLSYFFNNQLNGDIFLTILISTPNLLLIVYSLES